jgi:cytochrome c553
MATMPHADTLKRRSRLSFAARCAAGADPMIRSSTVILVCAALALAPGAASSADEDLISQAAAVPPDLRHGMILYLQHCTACHGRHAWGDGPREIPVLAGQQESYLIQQLAHFVNGTRQGSEMHGPIMHDTLQPSDLDRAPSFRDLATYLSSAPHNPHPEHGEGRTLTLGQRDYARGCSGCHGSDGGGSERDAIPAIGGQGYSYLLTQLRSFASGRLPHPAVADSPVALSADEQEAVADYVSRMSYLTAADAQ